MQEIFKNVYLILNLFLTVYTTSFINLNEYDKMHIWTKYTDGFQMLNSLYRELALHFGHGDSRRWGICGSERYFQKYIYYTGIWKISVSSILLYSEGTFSL